MTPQQLLAVLDELERRRRREYAQARAWLVGRFNGGHGGSVLPGVAGGVDDGRMVPMLLEYQDVADALQLSVSSIKRLVASGALPAVKVASARRVRRCDLEAYVHGLGREDRPAPGDTRRAP